jgi:hypothetical protein
MNSMQEALSDALEHPQEYHPQRPKPLQKAAVRRAASATWWTLGLCAGVSLAAFWTTCTMRKSHRSHPMEMPSEDPAGL